jgi:hypothetical protein
MVMAMTLSAQWITETEEDLMFGTTDHYFMVRSTRFSGLTDAPVLVIRYSSVFEVYIYWDAFITTDDATVGIYKTDLISPTPITFDVSNTNTSTFSNPGTKICNITVSDDHTDKDFNPKITVNKKVAVLYIQCSCKVEYVYLFTFFQIFERFVTSRQFFFSVSRMYSFVTRTAQIYSFHHFIRIKILSNKFASMSCFWDQVMSRNLNRTTTT